MVTRGTKQRKPVAHRIGAYLHQRIAQLVGIVATAGVLIGAVYTVDSFYVRTSSYDNDRILFQKQNLANSLSQEIATLETREAFTRYRLNDALRAAKRDDASVSEYRADLDKLARDINNKRVLMDQIRNP